MFCKNCGNKVKEKDEFCPFCGVKLQKNVEKKDIKKLNNKIKSSILKKSWIGIGVIAIIIILVTIVVFGGKSHKGEDKKDIIKTLQKFTSLVQRDDIYLFCYNDSWAIKYAEEKETVDIIESSVYDFLQSYTGNDFFGNAGHFTYDFDENAVRMYLDYKTDEGNISIINYDMDNNEYMVMADGDKYEASDELIDFIEKYGIIDIMKKDVEEFKNTLKDNNLSVEQVANLKHKDIQNFKELNIKEGVEDITNNDSKDEDIKTDLEANKENESSTEENEIKEDNKVEEEGPSGEKYYDASIRYLLEHPGMLDDEKVRVYGDFTSRHEIYIQDENNTIEVKYDKPAYDETGKDIGRVKTGDNGYVEGTYVTGENPYIQADKIVLLGNIARNNNQSLEMSYTFIGVEGVYNDFTHGSAYSSEIYIYISDMTEDTFWFVIFNGDDPIFAHNMAEITGDNTAVFNGTQYTLNFTWNGEAELTITGFHTLKI